MVPAPAHARSAADLNVNVTPLECSVDRLQSGLTLLIQISPNCVSETKSEMYQSSAERFYTPLPLVKRDDIAVLSAHTGYNSSRILDTTAATDRTQKRTNYMSWVVPSLLAAIVVMSTITIAAQHTAILPWMRRLLSILGRR